MQIHINIKGLILYLAVLAASLVFASFYGGPLVFAWLYAILFMLPLSGVYILLNYRFLRIFQEIDLHRVSKNHASLLKMLRMLKLLSCMPTCPMNMPAP